MACPDDFDIEGAYGDYINEPNDSTDNISLEVQFGDDDSRRASEISSISYQNLLDQDDVHIPDTSIHLHRDSDESDYEESATAQPIFSLDLSKVTTYISALSNDALGMTGNKVLQPVSKSPLCPDEHNIADNYRQGSDHAKISSCIGPVPHINNAISESCSQMLSSQAVVNSISQLSSSEPPVSSCVASDPCHSQSQRNSLSVRQTFVHRNPYSDSEVDSTSNNPIPHFNGSTLLSSHSNSLEKSLYKHNGAKPKTLKQSPGLARRVMSEALDVQQPDLLTNRQNGHSDVVSDYKDELTQWPVDANKFTDISNIEHNIESSEGEAIIEKLRCSTLQDFLSAHNIRQDLVDADQLTSSSSNIFRRDENVEDIENEYNYVKYSRVQRGNSYVGMRLAYSSAHDANHLNSKESLLDARNPNSQCHYGKQHSGIAFMGETLTEIPLEVSAENYVTHTVTLSPDVTECDSAAEIESVASDSEQTYAGLPAVEDGLSSSQNSDNDESSVIKSRRRIKSKPLKHSASPKNGWDPSGRTQLDPVTRHIPEEIDTQALMADLKAKRESLDHAILDIKKAIQQSKEISLRNTADVTMPDNGPVWVKREQSKDSQWYLKREEEMRRVIDDLQAHEDDEYLRIKQERAREEEAKKIKMKSSRMRERCSHLIQREVEGSDEDDIATHYQPKSVRRQGLKYTSVPMTDAVIDRDCSSENGQLSRKVIANGDISSSRNDYKRKDKLSKYSCPHIRAKSNTDYDTDEETDKLLDKPYRKDDSNGTPEVTPPDKDKRESRVREVAFYDSSDNKVLIEGVLFRARYLGSTQLVVEGQPSKAMRMMQAQEAVGRIKASAPACESQPSTEVDLFVSTEKIMVLNTDLQEIMMDHALKTISYIADIADILVIMARRSLLRSPDSQSAPNRKQAKILCHVFESEESQLIAQSIGQAFHVAYLEFLKANGIEDPGMREMDIQEVLNQQEIYGDELSLFANKDYHKEVVVPKTKGEPLGVVIVESGWGSMVPTVVLANMAPTGAAARCGQLNIGDQIISVNGISLVGLPLSSCQNYIKNAKNQTVVKLTVVPCPPVVEVIIKRPDVKYQLGFSVQNGVICSLLRGGIAERGGIRVGHRIIEINSQSVVAVPHEKIVSLLAHSVGEIHMKTMPTSIFRLLTGQDTPHYL